MVVGNFSEMRTYELVIGTNPVNEEYSRQRQSGCEGPEMGHSGWLKGKQPEDWVQAFKGGIN